MGIHSKGRLFALAAKARQEELVRDKHASLQLGE